MPSADVPLVSERVRLYKERRVIVKEERREGERERDREEK